MHIGRIKYRVMRNVGIICDINYERHHLFRSYFNAVKNIYGRVSIVKEISDLENIDILFIGDDHYGPHKKIWMNVSFINYCNAHNIQVVVMTNERILDSYFPWNKEIFLHLTQFDNLIHYVNDVDDAKKLGLRINRTAMSRSISFKKWDGPKKDRAVFVGNIKCKSYSERVGVLNVVRKILPIDVITDIPTWDAYMQLISQYRFVFSPIGNGNFFPMRFYEALAVNSIPLHQVRSDTLDYYTTEKKFDDCIFFETVDELKSKLVGFTKEKSHNVIWMEDHLIQYLKEDQLL